MVDFLTHEVAFISFIVSAIPDQEVLVAMARIRATTEFWHIFLPLSVKSQWRVMLAGSMRIVSSASDMKVFSELRFAEPDEVEHAEQMCLVATYWHCPPVK